MRRFSKVCLVLACICVGAGIGCVAVGISMGAKASDLGNNRIVNKIKSELDIQETGTEDFTLNTMKANIKNIEIDIGSANFQILESEDNIIRLVNDKGSRKIKAGISGDTLKINQKSRWFGFNFGWKPGGNAILYLPKDMKFDTVDIDLGSGSVDIDSIVANELIYDCGSGDISVEKCDANKVEIDCGSGNISIGLAGEEHDYRLDGDIGSGEVTWGSSQSFDGNDISIGQGHREIEVDLGSGDVEFSFLGREINHE